MAMITFNEYLIKSCRDKNNRLCIGLDFDNRKSFFYLYFFDFFQEILGQIKSENLTLNNYCGD